MFRDECGFIVDQTGDGGDSANRHGLAILFGYREHIFLKAFELDGIVLRHPFQEPWNNPKNFSRDQLLPYVAGCWRRGLHDVVRRVFWAHARRFFFAQNSERDVPGSTKYPWPHTFINDHGEKETRMFDFADPLDPSDIWHLILCGRIWYLYWFGIIGYPVLLLSLYLHCKTNKSDDERQIISKCVVAGKPFVELYKRWKQDWVVAVYRYWVERRNNTEMGELIVKGLGGD